LILIKSKIVYIPLLLLLFKVFNYGAAFKCKA
jgi:hypothetical protein